jgi:general secretion pathway protein D
VGFLAVQFFAFAEKEPPSVEEATHREQTRSELLEDVSESWRRSSPQPEREAPRLHGTVESPLVQKLESIVLPNVNFTRAEIGHVITALSAISAEFDQTGSSAKGVNIVLLDPGATKAPLVTVTLRNVSLKRALDFVTSSIDYHYELEADAVVVRPGGEASVLETEFFPVARATALRMAGGRSAGDGSPTKNGAIVSPPVGEGGEPAAYAAEARAIKGFLQQAGVNFDAVPGASLAYDGSAVIVTQTAPNLERARTILRRYTHVRQVEIEAKFMEVQEGALEELGVNWSVGQKATQHSGARATYSTSGRSLASAFSNTIGNQQGRIVRPETATTNADGAITFTTPIDIPIVNNAPSIPGSPSLAAAANPLATISGIVGEFDVNAIVRALSQKQGTDLLSAPKVTVLSGNPATMTVAQEMRYPQSFGQTQSQVGTGSASGGGSAGVAITAGTPQDFTSRNIGVELKVTPTVEEDDYSISLDLNPRVTEFDGFVEYGGPSIAISGGTTVTVPSGFFQPIFSVRDISTKVTIWDGATIVMGGLTREEVKRVNDKVPLLGSLPLIGRMFRSKGQSAQKRNLLIFLTANLVSPGGAHAQPNRQHVASIKAARREPLLPASPAVEERDVRGRVAPDAEIEKSAP